MKLPPFVTITIISMVTLRTYRKKDDIRAIGGAKGPYVKG